MPDNDYYKTLGISREATDDEIRKSYKKLAREYHPDLRPNDKAAIKKFKKIQEAYAILGDREKRDQYDRYGAAFQGAGPFPGGQEFRWSSGSGGGPIDLGEIFGGQFDLGDLFGRTTTRHGFGGAAPQKARTAEDRTVRLEAEILFGVAASGGTYEMQWQRGAKTERLSVKIPAGVETGNVIRLAGQGQPGSRGEPAGDLLLSIKVAVHPWFRREGSNLLLDVPITPAEAVLGAKVEVPTLSDGNMIVTIPPGTSSGMKLRLREKGGLDPKTQKRGDQLVIVKIVVARQTDDETRSLYERLANQSKHLPRDGLW